MFFICVFFSVSVGGTVGGVVGMFGRLRAPMLIIEKVRKRKKEVMKVFIDTMDFKI